MSSAKVWLVGAGPGDPELLTLKAVRALRQAEVVMVDDLVNPEILEHCPQARIIKVGKRGGCRSTPQAFINRLMLRYARQGKTLVRLKGGDPCIFGRASEEAGWLAERGVPSEIVNGITSGLAGATQCGIPLTLRGVSRGVTLVTAHTQDDSELNWKGLAQGGTTLVVYMGVAKLWQIQTGLLDGGMDAATPVAMIEKASSPDQRHHGCRLDQLCDQAATFELKSPAVLIIGEVVAAAHVLNLPGTVEHQPGSRKTLLHQPLQNQAGA
ncbi:MAG TPA: uroporphyrinogen-III C-methyltransferase [Pseudomonas xinjiangensis]|uniref:uroporphyrinogen-III C-methyltransferase n=2 Tax=root TaxID=1 RepID=A0A7V1BKX7_9GAMM|nr:uroporphyrinogen-III C-methyltransferase [Halopseudomonas xinjiangensis]HEC47430.1 uroporphyrinogen-III C-methyltransferase [Halopseudomonas xinjiangensis]